MIWVTFYIVEYTKLDKFAFYTYSKRTFLNYILDTTPREQIKSLQSELSIRFLTQDVAAIHTVDKSRFLGI